MTSLLVVIVDRRRRTAFYPCSGYMIKTVQQRTRDAFLLVVLVPAILGGITFWLERKNASDMQWVAHTQEVLRSVNRIVARAYQAESDQRGYLITNDQAYLQRYHEHTSAEQSELAAFQKLSADNPIQQENAQQLALLWRGRSQHMDDVLKSGYTPASRTRTLDLMATGRNLMDGMSEVANRMSAEEIRLLKIRKDGQRQTETAAGAVFVGAALINVLLLYWAYQMVKDYGAARDAAEAEIRRSNAELEIRVQQRTADLQAANENLTRSNEDLTRFAYVASHDLQEPLRTVGSYAGLLAKRYQGQLDAQADKYIGFIVSGAKRMQNLVQDLLMYSRTGTQQLTFGRVDLNAVLATVKQDLRVAIRDCGGHVLGESLPEIEGDEAKIGMVLQNLVSNGLKFRHTDRAPVVQVEARRGVHEWMVSVSDNGIGFDPQYAERIFVIFQRLHQIGEYAGTGIGLAICKRIVEGHGGRIWATSTPGVGSVFSFAIPVQMRNASEQAGSVNHTLNKVPKG